MESSGFTGYAPTPGRFDEAVDPAGAVRPAWRSLVETLTRLGPPEIEQRRRQADRLVAAQGAGHLFHDEEVASSPWRVDPVPLVLTGEEWAPLSAAIAQRARLLGAVLDDLYGDRRLLADGTIPIEAVAAEAGYEWPAVGTPVRGPRLVVYAADLIRTSEGTWRVLRDHTDAPSGAGYALLNRAVLTRLFPDVYRELGVARLTEFFGRFRAALAALAPADRANPRIVVLTSGVGHQSFFEHSYLAEQLGYNLVQGVDLMARDGRLWLRSLAGLEPVDVLLRRIEDTDADPLELAYGEGVGLPGLLHVVRGGGAGLANALGSGLASSLALQPFLDDAAARLLDQPLQLRSLETLWCGDEKQRAVVRERFDSMVLYEQTPLREQRSVFASALEAPERAAWWARTEADPYRFVAQEKIDFATAPMMVGASVVPATIVLRVHAVCGPDEVSVLPGGLGRVLEPAIPLVSQTSGLAKDVWVLERSQERSSPRRPRLTSSMPQIDLRSSLPTRAAESLFWMARHAERAEALARLTRTIVSRTEQDPDVLHDDGGWAEWATAGLRAVRVRTVGDVEPSPSSAAGDRLAAELTAAVTGADGLIAHVARLRRTASAVREFLSTTTWQILGVLDVGSQASADSLDRVVMALSALSGLAMESTVRGPSWRLLDLGRRLERAFVLVGAVESMLAPTPDSVSAGARYEVTLAAHESLVAYRRRYRSDARLDAVLELLVGDETNPRSLAFQLDRIAEHVAALPGPSERGHLELPLAAATRAVLRAPWHGLDPRQSAGRLAAVDQLIIDTRGPLLELGAGIVATWFADPAVVRRMGPRLLGPD